MEWPDGQPRYRRGQEWYCFRPGKKDFSFMIIDPEEADIDWDVGDGEKVCRLICRSPKCQNHDRCHHGTESLYSHKHLKENAILVFDPEHGPLRPMEYRKISTSYGRYFGISFVEEECWNSCLSTAKPI